MAATIAYMLEWNWQVASINRWTREATALLLENELSLQDRWWKVERTLLLEARHQRTARMAQKPHHQHLIIGLGWHPYRQMIRSLPAELNMGTSSHPL